MIRRRRAWQVIAAALLLAGAGALRGAPADPPQSWTAHVVYVTDGDTITVTRAHRRVVVRLLHIDAPERDQPYGRAAKRSLQRLLRGRDVRLLVRGRDRYHRVLAEVRRQPDGLDAGTEQLRLGLAWAYDRGRDHARYESMEREARRARRGLWRDRHPVRPARWRHGRDHRRTP